MAIYCYVHFGYCGWFRCSFTHNAPCQGECRNMGYRTSRWTRVGLLCGCYWNCVTHRTTTCKSLWLWVLCYCNLYSGRILSELGHYPLGEVDCIRIRTSICRPQHPPFGLSCKNQNIGLRLHVSLNRCYYFMMFTSLYSKSTLMQCRISK